MRCPKCHQEYSLGQNDNQSCPWCGHRPNGWQRWWRQKDRIAGLLGAILFIILPAAALITGQILIAGIVLSLVLGGLMIYLGITSSFNTAKSPTSSRWALIGFGALFVLIGLGIFVWLINDAPVPTASILPEDFFIYLGVFLIFTFGTRIVMKILHALLRKRVSKETMQGQFFLIPSFFTGILAVCTLLILPIEVLLPIAWLISLTQETSMEIGIGLGLPATMLPVFLFCLPMIRHNFGGVMITAHAITRYYLFSKKTIPWQEIKAIKVKSFAMPSALVIKGQGKKISFPRAIQGYQELLKTIKAYTQQTIQQTTKQPGQKTNQAVRFPYTIGIPKSRMILEVISMFLLIIIYLGLALIGLWIPLFRGDVPPFTSDHILSIALFFGMISIIFIPLMIMLAIQSFGRKQPTQIVLMENKIKFYYLWGREKTVMASDLEKIWMQPVKSSVRASYGGARVRGSTTKYDLHMQIASELNAIKLTANRMAMMKTNPEAILEIIHTLYPNIDR